VLIPRGVTRMARNEGDREAALAMVSVRMQDAAGDSHWREDFWPA
jgi:hypothetical protein